MKSNVIALLGAVAIVGLFASSAVHAQTTTPPVAPAPVATDPMAAQEFLDQRGIVGYSSLVSVEPGQTVDIMVSTKSPKFKSDLIRLVHGDADERGPGIKETVIESPANKEYDGVHQNLRLGSYVTVPDSAGLDLSSDFTITAWISPTTIPGSKLNPGAQQRTPAGTPRPQGIVSKWDDDANTGYGLFIEDDGSLALWVGAGEGKVEKVKTGVAMNPQNTGYALGKFSQKNLRYPTNFTPWYFVAASYNAKSGEVKLYQVPYRPYTKFPDATEKLATQSIQPTAIGTNDVPLLIGAGWDAEQPSGSDKGGLYNGKIDGPRVYNRVLSDDEVKALQGSGAAPDGAVAAWDFAQQPDTLDVIDPAGGNNGKTVNNPVRAVVGHNWTDAERDFRRSPETYNALYFHEDDLGETNWTPSVQYTIPADAKSGIYAARLTAGEDVYHAVFTVLPKPGTHTDVMFMVPELSYVAYTGTGARGFSGSQYSVHADGSGVVYASVVRPMVDKRPYASAMPGYRDGRPWQFEADTHIIDWLEQSGHPTDYVTDLEVHKNGYDAIKDYKVIVTGSHPEYISVQMWDALTEWLNKGGRLMYMGGNGYYWVTTLDKDMRYQELRRHDGTNANWSHPGEFYHSTTGEFGGLWRFRGRSPQELVGVGFSAQGFTNQRSRPYDIAEGGKSEGGAWVFEGVDTKRPMTLEPSLIWEGGAAGEEVDRAEYGLGTPANTLILATATGFDDLYHHVVEEVNTSNDMQGGTKNQLVRGDMTLMYYPNGGAVWSSSSIAWGGSLYYNNYKNDTARITQNVLDGFASGKPLPAAPADQ